MKRSILLEKLVKTLELQPLLESQKETVEIDTSELNRPGLQLSGFFEYFGNNRIQLIGMAEMTYLQDLELDVRKERLEKYFSYDIPCILISRNLKPPQDFIEIAKKRDIPVLSSGLSTSKLSHLTSTYLDNELAPSIARHGGLMDVYGIGLFITGESGVGKSETALELIKRGHRFVADDVVEIKKISDDRLIGQSPDIIRHIMEIRGIGLVDVSVLYGMGSVVISKSISLNIHLELGGSLDDIDRIGLADEYVTLLGVNIPKITIPVRPGRNLAIIMEVAAMNYRLKTLGQNAANSLDQNILDLLG